MGMFRMAYCCTTIRNTAHILLVRHKGHTQLLSSCDNAAVEMYATAQEKGIYISMMLIPLIGGGYTSIGNKCSSMHFFFIIKLECI